ncbi:MAG: hypothetical protein KDD63_27330, partial [Bacteroidetes bacterium]|nr:hypothetical protein [Bacteroidota bacterium]
TLQTTIWAATLLLIPAFVYPFQFWPDALEWFPFIRQFRSMGRLAWIFYYVFMVYSVVWVYKVYRAKKIHHQDKFATGFLIFVCLFWLFETGVYHQHERNKFLPNRIENYSERRLNFPKALEENGYHSSDFQAIIGLPYFHIGSEKLQFSHWEAGRLSMAVSRQTGLPMTNFMAARAPLTSSLASIQLGASPLIDKTLVEKLPNDKPFLLLYFKGDFSPGERRLIARSQQITSIGNFGLASLPLSAFKSAVESEIEKFEAGKDGLIPIGNQLFADHQTNGVYLETFGDHPAILGGESKFVKKGHVTLFDGAVHTRWENMVMELSFWVKLDQESNYLPRMDLSMFRNGELLEKQEHFMLETKDVYEGWARVRAEFMLKNP